MTTSPETNTTPTSTPPTTTGALHRRTLGRDGITVSSPGLGCMGFSGIYGATDDSESIRTIHRYLDAGGTLLDTGDFYAAGHNEQLIARALAGRDRDDVVLSVKFGAVLTPDGGMAGFDARPAAVKSSLTYSLQRLGTDHVDVYRPARLDPQVPIEETVGALAELVEQGYVRTIGLSEVGAETVRRAAAVAPISDVQLEYSLLSRGIEAEILPTCRELGIGVTAYGVLSRGLLGNGSRDGSRTMMPRFQGADGEHNDALVDRLRTLASARGVSVAQLAMAWVASRGEDVVPVIGARRPEQVDTMIAGHALVLTEADLARIEELVPAGAARGDRYPTAHMSALDSER